ncbi:hypothetical protein D2Q93_00140 [Alicyclobacillaceae bacterium I2511]|nr:hypothetical protein D2Q93_00140 [Alicyclobacillaceae bacterium I2511]
MTRVLTTQATQLIDRCELEVREAREAISAIVLHNQRKVLEAFWAERVSESDLQGSTGYGLADEGRDKLERIYARVFGAEAALVRPQIISGTHALRLGLFGVLRPGDEVLFAAGRPYDTLEAVVGIRPTPGSLMEWGITHRVVELAEDGRVNMTKVLQAIGPHTKMVMFQRSRGYQQRPAFSVEWLRAWFAQVRAFAPDIVIAVDNCYGEFVETKEPSEMGADLVMGSLIKNPGAGLALTGGYVLGRKKWVERAAAQLTAPGIGKEAGPTYGHLRSFYQALFLAPHTTGQAIQGSILASRVLEELDISVSPRWNEPRADLIVSAHFGDPQRLLTFCQVIQSSAPVDSFVKPDPAPMAGYEDPVIMAAGTFVQGGSLELSADAPMRPPYIAYFQGGLTYEHVRLALERVAMSLIMSTL